MSSQFPQAEPELLDSDSALQQEIERLYQFTILSRWILVGVIWIVAGSLSLWSIRADIQLWLDYFTWASVRYALAYNHVAAVGLGLCIGSTVAVLVWQSRNILWGLPKHEQEHLKEQVIRIRRQGKSHPLWQWVCRS
jgi:hypothetical protein